MPPLSRRAVLGLGLLALGRLLPRASAQGGAILAHQEAQVEAQLDLFARRLHLSPYQLQQVRQIIGWEIDAKMLERGVLNRLSPGALNQILALLERPQRKPFLDLLGPRLSELMDHVKRRRKVKPFARGGGGGGGGGGGRGGGAVGVRGTVQGRVVGPKAQRIANRRQRRR